MFEKASRLKLRYPSTKGNLTVEDLWDLPLTSAKGPSLDELAIALNKKVKETAEESFVIKKSTANTRLALMFDIVKHIIEVKMDEADAAKKRVAKKQQKDKLLGILAKKEDEELLSKNPDEIRKMLDELSD